MQKIYIQGQLFLKKGPKPASKELADSLKRLSYFFNGKAFDVEEGQLDYSGVNDIHRLIIYNNKFFLKSRDSFGGKRCIPITEQELEKDYIDFMKFLKESKYVGKYGRRTKPALGGKCISFMNEDVLILYHSNTHMIIYSDFIKEHYPFKTPIEILDSRYCNDWEIHKKSETLYNDPIELYKSIYKEPLDEENIHKRNL